MPGARLIHHLTAPVPHDQTSATRRVYRYRTAPTDHFAIGFECGPYQIRLSRASTTAECLGYPAQFTRAATRNAQSRWRGVCADGRWRAAAPAECRSTD